MSNRSIPLDISQITDYLYISTWPQGVHIEEIVSLNIRLILSMHWQKPEKILGSPPVHLLRLPTIDNPFFPMIEKGGFYWIGSSDLSDDSRILEEEDKAGKLPMLATASHCQHPRSFGSHHTV